MCQSIWIYSWKLWLGCAEVRGVIECQQVAAHWLLHSWNYANDQFTFKYSIHPKKRNTHPMRKSPMSQLFPQWWCVFVHNLSLSFQLSLGLCLCVSLSILFSLLVPAWDLAWVCFCCSPSRQFDSRKLTVIFPLSKQFPSPYQALPAKPYVETPYNHSFLSCVGILLIKTGWLGRDTKYYYIFLNRQYCLVCHKQVPWHFHSREHSRMQH